MCEWKPDFEQLKEQTYEGINAWTAFSLAQELTEDHPMFAKWFSAAKTALGTNATITRGVSACPEGWTVINTDA